MAITQARMETLLRAGEFYQAEWESLRDRLKHYHAGMGVGQAPDPKAALADLYFLVIGTNAEAAAKVLTEERWRYRGSKDRNNYIREYKRKARGKARAEGPKAPPLTAQALAEALAQEEGEFPGEDL